MRQGRTCWSPLLWVGSRLLIVAAISAALAVSVTLAAPSRVSEQQLGTIQLPAGFRVNVFAEGLGYARMMAFNGQGELVVTAPSREVAGDTCGGGGGCGGDGGGAFFFPLPTDRSDLPEH